MGLLSTAITGSGLTQQQLEDRTGYSQSVISNLKTRTIIRPTFVLVTQIARVLRLSLDDIASEIGIPVAGARRARTIQQLEAICTALETTTHHDYRDRIVAELYAKVFGKGSPLRDETSSL